MPLTINLIMSILNVFAPVLIYAALLPYPTGVRWGVAAAAFVLLFFVSAYISVGFRKRMLYALYEECDPEKLIVDCRRTVEHPLASLQKRAVNETRLLYATGLFAAGRFEEAAGMLNNVMPFPKTSKGGLLEITRSCLKTDLLTHFRESARAREEYETVKRLTKELGARKPRLSAMFGSIIEECDIHFRIEDVDDGGAEKHYVSAFENAKTVLSKVTAKYNLGLHYARHGQTEKAAEAFEYAAGNGNKLHIAKEAKRLLDELPQSNADNV